MDTNPTPPASSGTEKPEEYIRTFSNDVDTFEKGGIPGLTPFTPSTPVVTEVSPEPASSIERLTQPKPMVKEGSAIPLITSEEYIRTFASDMDAVQKGGTPGFAPLKSGEEFPDTAFSRPPMPIPEAISAPSAPLPRVQSSGPIPAERLVAASPISEEPIKPQVQTSFTPVPPPVPTVPISNPIETYAQDFRDRVQDTHASTSTILAAEQDEGKESRYSIPEKPAPNIKNILYIAAGIIMLIVGGVSAYIAYSNYVVTTSPVVIPQGIVLPIFVDSRDSVSGTGNALMQSINQSVSKPLPLNTIRLLSLGSATSTTNVFTALSMPVPSIVTRNLNATGNMAGVVYTTSGESPFFILSVSSYGATFSGMLSWEPAMQKDLGMLFPLYVDPVATAATSTPANKTVTATTTNASLSKVGFRDEVVSNHDVRIYRDSKGRSILLYGYWNQMTLIIARDPVAFSEIIARLSTSHTQQ